MRTKLLTAVGAALALGLGLAATPASALPAADAWYTITGAGGWVELTAANTGGAGNCPQTTASSPICGTLAPPFSFDVVTGTTTFHVTLFAGTNGPGSPALADTTNSSITVKNIGAAAGDIWFVAGGTGFLLPTGTVLQDTNAGTVVSGGGAGNTVDSFACLREDNLVDGTHSCDSAGSPPDLITPVISGGLPTAGNPWTIPSAQVGTGPLPLTTPYSLIQELRFTMTAGTEVTFSSQARVLPVPEPASLAILGSALLGFGFIQRRRRNRG